MGKAGWLSAFGLVTGAAFALERRERGRLARRSTVLSTPRGSVEVEITGAGPDVLLLHGAGGGFDQGTWMAHALGLRGHRLISLSRPGYLRTPDLPTNDEAIELAVATLDALGVARAAVIGASGGGMLACGLAMRHPERLSALVMLSAVSGPVIGAGPALALYFARTGSDVNRAILAAMATATGRRLITELVRTLAAPERRLPGVRRDLAVSRSFRPPTGIVVPTLVIHGTADGAVPFEHALRTVAGCTNGELVTIRGGGHLCCMTHREVGQRIGAFLDSIDSTHST